MIDRLRRAPVEKDRQPHLRPLELPLVQQLCPGECEDRHCCSAPFCVRKRGSSPGLVMVLDEPHHFCLVRKIGKEVQTYALGVPVFHPIIESLVVAAIKTLLLQFPLEVPVCLGDEPELPMPSFDRRDHRRPVVIDRLYSCTSPPRYARRYCSA